MMNQSMEIRWFWEQLPPTIENWFQAKSLIFKPIEDWDRKDFYLKTAAPANQSIKLREGNLEIKQRVKNLDALYFDPKQAKKRGGIVELWCKWGFKVAGNDFLTQQIIGNGLVEWVEVAKERLLVKYAIDLNAQLTIPPNPKKIAEGGQVEITKILVQNKQYYTFAIESFSDSGAQQRNFDIIIKQIIKELPLDLFKIKDSESYPSFLK
jgi:hypothetical protein